MCEATYICVLMKIKQLFIESVKFIMVRVAIFVILTLAIQFHFSLNNQSDDQGLTQYTEETFFNEISTNSHIILFTNSKCKKCEKLSDDLILARKYYEEMLGVQIAKVDCETDHFLCSQFNLTEQPTLMFFNNGERLKIKFTDILNFKSMKTFIENQSETVSKYNFKQGNHFVKFYASWCPYSKKLNSTWYQLEAKFAENPLVNLCKVNCLGNSICEEDYFISEYPSLIWIKDGKIIDNYVDSYVYDSLVKYIEKMIEKNSDETISFIDNKTIPSKMEDEL